MKKLFYFAAAAALVFGAAACNGNKENVNEQGLVDDGGAKLTPDQQKSKIEETADALMSDLDLKVWQSEYDLVNNTIQEMQDKDVDASVIEERINAIIDAWTTMTGEEPGVVYTHVAHLSQLTGHFTENAEGGFDYEAANDLAITIFSGGKTITATASVKDRDEKVLLQESFNNGTDASGNQYHSGDYTYAYVPEKANLAIAVDGSSLASLEIRLNYTDVDKNGEADQNDKLDLGYTMTVGAYTFSIDQADYATDSANVKLSFSKEGKLVLGVDAKAAARIEEIQYEYGTRTEFVPVSADVKVNIEGKIQLVGSLPSYDHVEKAQEELNNSSDFEKFKVALDKFEKSFGIGLYYDGTNTLQATLGFEPVNKPAEQAGWDINGDGVTDSNDVYPASFTFDPVIRFADGTSYTAEAFAQKYGQNLAAKIQEWVHGIQDYLGLKKTDNSNK